MTDANNSPQAVEAFPDLTVEAPEGQGRFVFSGDPFDAMASILVMRKLGQISDSDCALGVLAHARRVAMYFAQQASE